MILVKSFVPLVVKNLTTRYTKISLRTPFSIVNFACFPFAPFAVKLLFPFQRINILTPVTQVIDTAMLVQFAQQP